MASFIFTSLMSIGSSDTQSKLNSLPKNLPPCHSVRIKLEARQFEEARHESKKEYEKKFR